MPESDTTLSGSPQPWIRLVALAGVVALIGIIVWRYGELISLASLAERETQLRTYQSEHPYLVFGFAFAAYVTVAGLSLPGAAALTLVFGWYFGFWPALFLISFASTVGATIAFLMCRYFLGDWVQRKFGQRLQSFNRHLESDGAFYLFTLRLVPAVPFFVINLVMGLTQLAARTFYWVSQIGMLPGTAVYVYAGSSVPNLQRLADEGAGAVFSTSQLAQLAVAFGLLGVFPLIVKKVSQLIQPAKESQ